MKRISLPNYISRSGARFETTERFLQSTSVVNSTESELKSTGIPLTHIDENTYATSTDELHCFVIGDSGCGKTRRVILPTIRLLAKAGESMVISDPKGELFRITANSLKEKGYTVQVLNFRNPRCGHRWNPLGLIDELYHSAEPEGKDKAVMMLGDIVDVLQQGLEGQDPFWSMSAADVMRGVSLLILEYGESKELTFENISITAREIREKILEMEKNKKEYEASKRSPFGKTPKYEPTAFESFLSSLPKNSPILNNLSVIITNAEETRNCIMAEFEAMISLYISQESLMDLFAVSEIDINALGLKPTALFFILPDDTEALYPIATIFVKQIYSTLIALADEQHDGKLTNRVTFLLDEFANFAKMPSIESMLTAARSRRIRFVLVCQSMDQLTAKYNDHGRETLLSNCRTWLYMSCRNLPFLERLEALMGYYISPYTNERIPLVDIGELQHFEIGQVLVLNDRCRPMMGYLPDYSQYDFGIDGNDVSIELPAPHDLISRKLFSLEKGLEKAKRVNAPIVEQHKLEAKQETDGLRASILEKIAEQRQRTDEDASEVSPTSSSSLPFWSEELGKDDDDDGDIDSLIARLDARIAELEAEEAKKEESAADADESLSVMDLFRQGDYLEAAQQSIVQASFLNDISSKNNIAFLIRFGELDPSKLSAPFSLKIPDLLHDGLEAKEPYSILNYALYEIDTKQYESASNHLLQLSEEDWNLISTFWLVNIYQYNNYDPEAAFVLLLARNHDKRLIVPNSSPANLYERARVKYGDFMDSTYFQRVYKESQHEKSSPTANKDGNLSSMLDLLLSDEEDDEEAVTTRKDDSAGFEDLKAQLQKKIQEKLKQSAENPDEDDED